MPNEKKNRLPRIAILCAVLVGMTIGSREELTSFFARNSSSADEAPLSETRDSGAEVTEAAPHAGPPAAASPAGNAQVDVRPAVAEPELRTIRAANGVVIQSLRQDGKFSGYRVSDSGQDTRLADGAVIVAIDGIPVEDSAGGSELLLISLTNPATQFEFLEQESQ